MSAFRGIGKVFCVAAFVFLTVPLMRAQVPEDTRNALHSILHQQEIDWNQGDGKGFAVAFADDAEFINIRGDLFRGKEMIADRHTFILTGPFRGSHVVITVRQYTELTPDIVIVEMDHTLTNYRSLPPGISPTSSGVLKTRMKYIAKRNNGQWQLIAGQNTAVSPMTPPAPQ